MSTIVVGYDGSEHAERALDRAIQLGVDGTDLVVVAAADLTSRAGGFAGTRGVDPIDEEVAKHSLEGAQSKAGEKGVSARFIKAHGEPAHAIVEQAREAGADLIIVGTHGRNAAQRSLLGSVSTAVVHRAPCDVLVVR